MAAFSGSPFNPSGCNAINPTAAPKPLSGSLRDRPPAPVACSLSHGLSLSLLASLSATWRHGRLRARASVSDASTPLDEPSWRKGRSRSLLERFPLRAAVTAGGLALAGDTLAQLVERRPWCQWQRAVDSREGGGQLHKEAVEGEAGAAALLCSEETQHHDLMRALRMGSYGFLLYGPACHVWYRWLDSLLPQPTLTSFALKVLANQVVVGPTVLLVVFAWNLAWMGRARHIPDKYQRDFFPSLKKGYTFWIPATCLNFAVVPLEARVAFMSCCAIFWNFHLSSSIANEAARPAINEAVRLTGSEPAVCATTDSLPSAINGALHPPHKGYTRPATTEVAATTAVHPPLSALVASASALVASAAAC